MLSIWTESWKNRGIFFQAVVFYGKIDIFAQISIWTEKTGEYCLPKRLAQRHLQKKFLFSSVVWNCSSHGPGATFLAARRLPNTDRGPWAGQHRPPPYFGATILAGLPYSSVSAHHTSEPPYLQAYHSRQYQPNHTLAAYMHLSRRPTILTSRPILLSNL